ncbi:peptidyl-tRNA hydrolase [[Bacillus] enclensis]|uniref:peptidyl-tRNA hydrolase n=1 Tax=[Bacillus] enclensis TaxID=1402860 RepID=A0A0V8HL43_9BACI|nr:aminoacyl-tRNA hydrolase [[Bacillus] enclensis]KSU63278.1 peptidyl-tRNA hydrolase [[Bacillus] enclensis]SCB81251.1 peptidyl-tRNA hydrolase, PTH2 family [[Bacillus] enclensis]
MTNNRDLVQYFVVNKDVNMSKGKTAAQVAHAATLSTLEMVSDKTSFADRQPDFVEWLQTGMKKIILKGSQPQLEKLEKGGFFSIRDSGLTEIQKGSLTVIALPPMDKWEAKEIVGHLTLLKN